MMDLKHTNEIAEEETVKVIATRNQKALDETCGQSFSESRIIKAVDQKLQDHLPPVERRFSSSTLERKPSLGEDPAAMTIQFLRARLLSERSISKAARQRAQQLAKKVSELESQLELQVQLRKRAEAVGLEVLEKYNGDRISESGEEIASFTWENDLDKKRDIQKEYFEIIGPQLKGADVEGNMEHERANSKAFLRSRSTDDDDDFPIERISKDECGSTEQLNSEGNGNEDSASGNEGDLKGSQWQKIRSASEAGRGAQKKQEKDLRLNSERLGRISSQDGTAALEGSDSRSRRRMGKSIRQIRKKEPRPAIQDEAKKYFYFSNKKSGTPTEPGSQAFERLDKEGWIDCMAEFLEHNSIQCSSRIGHTGGNKSFNHDIISDRLQELMPKGGNEPSQEDKCDGKNGAIMELNHEKKRGTSFGNGLGMNMEKIIENQVKLIELSMADENAQRVWEENLTEQSLPVNDEVLQDFNLCNRFQEIFSGTSVKNEEETAKQRRLFGPVEDARKGIGADRHGLAENQDIKLKQSSHNESKMNIVAQNCEVGSSNLCKFLDRSHDDIEGNDGGNMNDCLSFIMSQQYASSNPQNQDRTQKDTVINHVSPYGEECSHRNGAEVLTTGKNSIISMIKDENIQDRYLAAHKKWLEIQSKFQNQTQIGEREASIAHDSTSSLEKFMDMKHAKSGDNLPRKLSMEKLPYLSGEAIKNELENFDLTTMDVAGISKGWPVGHRSVGQTHSFNKILSSSLKFNVHTDCSNQKFDVLMKEEFVEERSHINKIMEISQQPQEFSTTPRYGMAEQVALSSSNKVDLAGRHVTIKEDRDFYNGPILGEGSTVSGERQAGGKSGSHEVFYNRYSDKDYLAAFGEQLQQEQFGLESMKIPEGDFSFDLSKPSINGGIRVQAWNERAVRQLNQDTAHFLEIRRVDSDRLSHLICGVSGGYADQHELQERAYLPTNLSDTPLSSREGQKVLSDTVIAMNTESRRNSSHVACLGKNVLDENFNHNPSSLKGVGRIPVRSLHKAHCDERIQTDSPWEEAFRRRIQDLGGNHEQQRPFQNSYEYPYFPRTQTDSPWEEAFRRRIQDLRVNHEQQRPFEKSYVPKLFDVDLDRNQFSYAAPFHGRSKSELICVGPVHRSSSPEHSFHWHDGADLYVEQDDHRPPDGNFDTAMEVLKALQLVKWKIQSSVEQLPSSAHQDAADGNEYGARDQLLLKPESSFKLPPQYSGLSDRPIQPCSYPNSSLMQPFASDLVAKDFALHVPSSSRQDESAKESSCMQYYPSDAPLRFQNMLAMANTHHSF